MERQYREARRLLLSEPLLNTLVPPLMRDCRTAAHLYRRMEAEFGLHTFSSKRDEVWKWFVPMLNKAEFEENFSADADLPKRMAAAAPAPTLVSAKPTITAPGQSPNIFIGHGHSLLWRTLKDFIADDLKLPWDEFNREPTPGIATSERLKTMLQKARFAFLVMTGKMSVPAAQYTQEIMSYTRSAYSKAS